MDIANKFLITHAVVKSICIISCYSLSIGTAENGATLSSELQEEPITEAENAALHAFRNAPFHSEAVFESEKYTDYSVIC